MNRVLNYFRASGDYNPWRNNPQTPTDKSELSCRKSFHVFMTDGAWNSQYYATGGIGVDGDGIAMGGGNADGTSLTLPDGVRYDTSSSQTRFYRDAAGLPQISTFSDLAFYLWATDLRPDLTNNVRYRQKVRSNELYGTLAVEPYWNPKNNPASWQHVVTYTVGFKDAAANWGGSIQWEGNMYSGTGIKGLAEGSRFWAAPLCGTNQNTACTLDESVTSTEVASRRKPELWHAAFNSRGAFYPAPDATALINAFKAILTDIRSEGLGGVVSVGANTRLLRKDGNLFLLSYSTEPWAGDVISLPLKAADASTGSTPNWSAAVKLDATTLNIDLRLVLTHNGKTGVGFAWTNLDSGQKSALKSALETDTQGQARLRYLRGDRSTEQSQPGGVLRTRGSRLGTIVNSNVWVQGESPNYPVEYAGHAAFRKLLRDQNRPTMLAVGANDGMLHVFHAGTGDELLAYVPLGVYSKLVPYSDPRYSHQYMVDGSPFMGDVDISGSGIGSGAKPVWRTLLVAPLGAGGRGYAVLDLTSANTSDLQQGTTVVLDATSASDGVSVLANNANEIGHMTAPPATDPVDPRRADQFVKLNNGRWAVLLGNGVNSVAERAVLLVQYLDGARELLAIPAQSGTKLGNGLGTPRPLDVDGNGTVDMVYAGDLLGNLWKFDLSSTNPSQWGLAGWGNTGICRPGGSIVCQPLMSAADSTGKAQPVLVAPMWIPHPMGGVMLNFGTGRMLEDTDRASTSVQSLYGVWDSTTYTRSGGVVVAAHGPNVPAGTTRSRLIQQSFTGQVARTQASTDLRNFFNSSSNPVIYSVNNSASPRGWFIDLPASGERLLSNPQIFEGSLVRFSSQVPAEAPVDGACLDALRPDLGYTNILNGITGAPFNQAVFYSADSTLDLSRASRVQFGAGESVDIETGTRTMVYDINSAGTGLQSSGSATPPLGLNRLKSVPRRVDWRILP